MGECQETKKPPKWRLTSVLKLAGPTGLEPATSGVTGRRSNRLNYDPASVWKLANGTPRQLIPEGARIVSGGREAVNPGFTKTP